MNMRSYVVVMLGLLFGLVPMLAHASVTEFENKTAWQNAVGAHTAITFRGYPEHMIITNQYAALGVVFPDGNDSILYNDSLLNDGVGLKSSDIVMGMIHMTFAQPMTAIAADFLSLMDIQLYSLGHLIHSSTVFSAGPDSRFGGVISTIAFDAAVIRDPTDGVVVIDDLYFGPPIPGPGALAVFALAAFARPRRRR